MLTIDVPSFFLFIFVLFFFPGNDVGLLHEKVFRKENLLTVNVGKTKTLKEGTAEGLVALVEQLTSVHAENTVSLHHCSLFPSCGQWCCFVSGTWRLILSYFRFLGGLVSKMLVGSKHGVSLHVVGSG